MMLELTFEKSVLKDVKKTDVVVNKDYKTLSYGTADDEGEIVFNPVETYNALVDEARQQENISAWVKSKIRTPLDIEVKEEELPAYLSQIVGMIMAEKAEELSDNYMYFDQVKRGGYLLVNVTKQIRTVPEDDERYYDRDLFSSITLSPDDSIVFVERPSEFYVDKALEVNKECEASLSGDKSYIIFNGVRYNFNDKSISNLADLLTLDSSKDGLDFRTFYNTYEFLYYPDMVDLHGCMLQRKSDIKHWKWGNEEYIRENVSDYKSYKTILDYLTEEYDTILNKSYGVSNV